MDLWDELFSEGAAAPPGQRYHRGERPWPLPGYVPSEHNIIHTYDQANDQERDAGHNWYHDAHELAGRIAGGGEHPSEEHYHRGAGVISALSPQTPWERNVHLATRTFRDNGLKGGTLGDHMRKANAIQGGQRHTEVLTAPKTRSFADNIEHPALSREVTIDVHAFDVAVGHTVRNHNVGAKILGSESQRQHYTSVADAYRRATDLVNKRDGTTLLPHQVQAVSWLTARRQKDDGEFPDPEYDPAKGHKSPTAYRHTRSNPSVLGSTQVIAEAMAVGSEELGW